MSQANVEVVRRMFEVRASPPPHSTGTQAATNFRAVASVLLSLKVVRRSLTNLLFQDVTQR